MCSSRKYAYLPLGGLVENYKGDGALKCQNCLKESMYQNWNLQMDLGRGEGWGVVSHKTLWEHKRLPEWLPSVGVLYC